MNTIPSIGFIGAGQLGRPALERLLGAGADVRLHARRGEVRDAFRSRVVTVSDDPATVARGVEALVVFVFDGGQLRAALLGDGHRDGALAAMTPGAVVVIHTTASLSDLEVVAAAADEMGVAVVDAPVSGTADDIRAGQLTVLLGGDDSAVEIARDVVAAYAATMVPVGPRGSAMRVKLINNLVFAAHVQVALGAADLAAAMGIDRARALDAMLACSGSSDAMRRLRELDADTGEFGARVGPYLRKDVAACTATAALLGLDVETLLATVRGGPLPLA